MATTEQATGATSPAKLTDEEVHQLVIALGQGHGVSPSFEAALAWIRWVEFIRAEMFQIEGVLAGRLLVRMTGDAGPEYGTRRLM